MQMIDHGSPLGRYVPRQRGSLLVRSELPGSSTQCPTTAALVYPSAEVNACLIAPHAPHNRRAVVLFVLIHTLVPAPDFPLRGFNQPSSRLLGTTDAIRFPDYISSVS